VCARTSTTIASRKTSCNGNRPPCRGRKLCDGEMQECADSPTVQMSGCQQQRVALDGALAIARCYLPARRAAFALDANLASKGKSDIVKAASASLGSTFVCHSHLGRSHDSTTALRFAHGSLEKSLLLARLRASRHRQTRHSSSARPTIEGAKFEVINGTRGARGAAMARGGAKGLQFSRCDGGYSSHPRS